MEGVVPAKSIVMAFILSGWLVVLIVAGLIVAYTGFFGLAVLGLVVLCLGVIVDQERDGVVGVGGASATPGFLAQQVKARAEMTPMQRHQLRHEHWQEARVTLRFKYLGLGMLVVGLAGFWFFQL
jgi:hypothetical protein